jgi:RimJ/RimL family protein N-acetyltransferase
MTTLIPAIDRNLELVGDRVSLRPLGRQGDIADLHEAARESINEVGPWLAWCHSEYALEDTATYIEFCRQSWGDGREYSFAILDGGTKRFLGGIGINLIDWANRRANLGYWVRTSATGRGYASDAARALARWGLEQLGLTRIEIVAAIGNIASQRVAAKAGATPEGVLRSRIVIDGIPHDAAQFSFVPADFIASVRPQPANSEG